MVGKVKLPIMVVKSSADADLPDKLFIDSDGNGKFEASESISLDAQRREQKTRSGTVEMVIARKPGLKLKIDGKEFSTDLQFAKRGATASMVQLVFGNYLHAETEIAGKQRVIAIVDSDFSGKYGDQGDMWALTSPAARPTSAYAMHAIGEGHFEAGTLTKISVDGHQVKLASTKSDGPPAADLAAQRHRAEKIWSDRFDVEREGFIKARGLDTSRPLAKATIEWKQLTFDEGLALSKKTGKPLFVDIMAFWCVWCYRLDYYTYPDKEVADLMNKSFIPVKIIQEQDRAGDYSKVQKKIGARGIPAMGVFDGEGKMLHKISGWKKPEDFVKELQKALEAKGG
jgi:thiol-disulfide isomerase/thioredoxin